MKKDLVWDSLVNALRAKMVKAGGFVFVELYDAEDYDKFMLGEDEIKALHNYLGNIIQENKLQ